MYGLAVNLIMSVSGHPSIINEMADMKKVYDNLIIFNLYKENKLYI